MHVLEGQVQTLGPLGHKAPHEAVNVERGPADPKHHDQHNCGGTEGRLGYLPDCLPRASGWSAHSHHATHDHGPSGRFWKVACLSISTPSERLVPLLSLPGQWVCTLPPATVRQTR